MGYKKMKEDKVSERITVCCTPEERAELRKKAQGLNLTLSNYVRLKLGFTAKLVGRPKK